MKRSELTALVVEDHDDVRPLLLRFLERAGISNRYSAQDEETALKIIEGKNVDLIVSDTMYCSSDPYGPRIAKRAEELGQHPVIIAISGHSDHLKKWDEIQPKYKLVKPISIFEFVDIIKKEFPEE